MTFSLEKKNDAEGGKRYGAVRKNPGELRGDREEAHGSKRAKERLLAHKRKALVR